MVNSTVSADFIAILRMVVDCSHTDSLAKRFVLLDIVELFELVGISWDKLLVERIIHFDYLECSTSYILQLIL